jgi:hypothetical protein
MTGLGLLCFLTFLLGLAIGDSWQTSLEYRTAIESLRLDAAAKVYWIKVSFWGGLVAITLVGVGGGVGVLLRLFWRRSRLIQPHSSGLFPIVEGQAGGETYYHDPNRQLAGTTLYGADSDGATIRHQVPQGEDEAQLQIATQAQATQLVAAANQGKGLTARNRKLVERMASTASTRPLPRLPEIVILDNSIPEERRLLAALRRDWEDELEGGE